MGESARDKPTIAPRPRLGGVASGGLCCGSAEGCQWRLPCSPAAPRRKSSHPAERYRSRATVLSRRSRSEPVDTHQYYSSVRCLLTTSSTISAPSGNSLIWLAIEERNSIPFTSSNA